MREASNQSTLTIKMSQFPSQLNKSNSNGSLKIITSLLCRQCSSRGMSKNPQTTDRWISSTDQRNNLRFTKAWTDINLKTQITPHYKQKPTSRQSWQELKSLKTEWTLNLRNKVPSFKVGMRRKSWWLNEKNKERSWLKLSKNRLMRSRGKRTQRKKKIE